MAAQVRFDWSEARDPGMEELADGRFCLEAELARLKPLPLKAKRLLTG
jgi:hypothetical protein